MSHFLKIFLQEGVKDYFTVKRHKGILNATKKNGRILGNAASITTIADVESLKTVSNFNEADDLNLSPFSHQVYQWEDINSVRTNGRDNTDTTDAVHVNLSKETEPEDAVWTDPTFADGQKEEEHAAEDVETGNQVDQTQESLNTQSPTTALNPENLTAIQNSNLPSEQTKTSQSTQISKIDIMVLSRSKFWQKKGRRLSFKQKVSQPFQLKTMF